METNRLHKIAFGLTNILGEEYYGLSVSIKQAIACLSGIYSIETNFSEIIEAMDFFNEYVRDYQRKVIPDIDDYEILVIKKEGVIYDKTDYYIYQNGLKRDFSDPNKREIFTHEPYVLLGWIELLKTSINDAEFTDKYLPLSDYDGSYDIQNIPDGYEDETEEEYESVDEVHDIDDDENYDFDDEDEGFDPMEVRRDAWGDLYTVGGQMWNRAMNKRKDEEEY